MFSFLEKSETSPVQQRTPQLNAGIDSAPTILRSPHLTHQFRDFGVHGQPMCTTPLLYHMLFSLDLVFWQSILEYNGAAILAMTGKNCVGICSDSRLGNQAQTVATDFEKIFKMGDQLMVCGDGSTQRSPSPAFLGGMLLAITDAKFPMCHATAAIVLRYLLLFSVCWRRGVRRYVRAWCRIQNRAHNRGPTALHYKMLQFSAAAPCFQACAFVLSLMKLQAHAAVIF